MRWRPLADAGRGPKSRPRGRQVGERRQHTGVHDASLGCAAAAHARAAARANGVCDSGAARGPPPKRCCRSTDPTWWRVCGAPAGGLARVGDVWRRAALGQSMRVERGALEQPRAAEDARVTIRPCCRHWADLDGRGGRRRYSSRGRVLSGLVGPGDITGGHHDGGRRVGEAVPRQDAHRSQGVETQGYVHTSRIETQPLCIKKTLGI